jgi:MoxR-like ATPase
MAAPDHAYHPDHALDMILEAIQLVNRRIINRREVIDQIFSAMLMREHALIQSRTGAAKSLLAQQIFSMFEGANVFMVQASKEQQPDTYFGGLDIEELKKGRIMHNTANSLVESEFGFIDEIFDANDYTLRALLTTLNERALILGVQQVPARVHSVIAATNYLRVSEVTEALLDRFVFKALFIPAKEPYTQYQIAQRYLLHKGKPTPPERPIPFAVLDRTANVIKGFDPEYSIHIPLEVIFFANSVVRYYEMQKNRLVKEHPQDHPHV